MATEVATKRKQFAEQLLEGGRDANRDVAVNSGGPRSYG